MPHGKGHRLTLVERETAVEMYEMGESATAIGRAFDVSSNAVVQLLKRLGIARRSMRECHQTCSLDETVFDTLTPDSAYWIGMLMSDGYMNTVKHAVELRLQARDRAHIEKFRAFMGSTHAVHTKHKTASVGVVIRSPHLFDTLGRYGVKPNKSLTAEATPELAHSRDFWRGMIDGDGCIKNYKACPRMHLIGSEATIRQFEAFCAPYLDGYPLKTRTCKHSPRVWNAMMHGNAAMTMLRVLYKDAAVYLDRKKAFADEMEALYAGRTFRTLKKFTRPSATPPASPAPPGPPTDTSPAPSPRSPCGSA